MDENIKEILNELKSINTKIDSISDGQKRLEDRQEKLEKRQSNLEEGQQRLEIRQSNLEDGQKSILDYLYQLEAKNAERHLYMLQQLEQMNKDIKYLKHKDQQKDNDIVTIKSKLDII